MRLPTEIPRSNSVFRLILNPLYSNTGFLFIGQILSSGLMYVFWIMASRTLPAKEVGIAVGIISAINLLAVIGNMGLGTAIVGLSTSYTGKRAANIVNVSIATGTLTSLIVSGIFILGTPIWAPSLLLIRQELPLAIAFVFFVIVSMQLNLHSAAMLSRRKGEFLFIRFLVGALLTILLALFLRTILSGIWIILLSYFLPIFAILVTSSILVLPRFFEGFKLIGSLNLPTLTELVKYAPVNHLADLLWSLPQFLLPLIVAYTFSSENIAFFYMPWMIASVIQSLVRAGSTSLFVEGSRESNNLYKMVMRIGMLDILFVVPCIVFLGFFGENLLRLFGKSYINMGLLVVLLISVIPFIINDLTFVVLRVQRKTNYLILFSFFTIITSLVLSFYFSSVLGLFGIGFGWFVGQSMSMIFICLLILGRRITI